MSREGENVIFWTFVICTLHDGPPGDSLLAPNPSRKASAPVTLNIAPLRDRPLLSPRLRLERCRERSRSGSQRPCSPARRRAKWHDCPRDRIRGKAECPVFLTTRQNSGHEVGLGNVALKTRSLQEQ